MTTREIFALRQDGRTDDAYEAARQLYATDKGAYASAAMFWTAVDALKVRQCEGRTDEAVRILRALERLLPNVPDRTGSVARAYEQCEELVLGNRNGKNGRGPASLHTQLGVWGEEVAVAYLLEQGYVIIERDWHSGHRDIDIIARQDDTIVFIEVKTRRNTVFGQPEAAVDWQKRRNLRHAVSHYMNYRKVDLPTRFDIITVVGVLGCTSPVIDHIKDVSIAT